MQQKHTKTPCKHDETRNYQRSEEMQLYKHRVFAISWLMGQSAKDKPYNSKDSWEANNLCIKEVDDFNMLAPPNGIFFSMRHMKDLLAGSAMISWRLNGKWWAILADQRPTATNWRNTRVASSWSTDTSTWVSLSQGYRLTDMLTCLDAVNLTMEHSKSPGGCPAIWS